MSSTRTLTGKILMPDETAYTSAVLNIELVADIITADTVYPKRRWSISTDTNGDFSVDLGVPDTGTAIYLIWFNNIAPVYTVNLGAGEGSVDLSTALILPTIGASPSALQTLLDAHVSSYLHFRANVKSYGALGNGIHDDTAAFIAAAADYNAVYIPEGNYSVKPDSIILHNRTGFHLYGEGYNSALYCSGTGDSIIKLNGVSRAVFERFLLMQSAGNVQRAIGIEWDGVGTRSTNLNTFNMLDIGNLPGAGFGVGFGIGTDPGVDDLGASFANDGNHFYNCHVGSDWAFGNTTTAQAAFRIGNGTGGNNLNHIIENCNSRYVRYFIDANKANFHCHNCQPVRGEGVFNVKPWENSSIQNINVEGFSFLINWINETAATNQLDLKNVAFRGDSVADSGEWIYIKDNGAVELSNLKATWIRVGITAKMRFATFFGLDVQMDRIYQPTPYAQAFIYVDGDAPITLSGKNYFEIDEYERLVNTTKLIGR